MIKAGYEGSAINEVVWMGDVVNEAAKLCAGAGRGLFPNTIMVSGVFYSNLNDDNKQLLQFNSTNGCYQGNVISTARGTRAMTGALIGGLVLGAGSAIGWNELCEIDNEGRGCDETGKVVGLTMLGVAAGAGLGALIGSAAGTWRLQYARPGARLQLSPVSLNHVRLVVTLPL
jgi:hypothetical protein